MQTLTDALANALAPVAHDVALRRVTRDAAWAFVIEGLRRDAPLMLRARAVVLCAPARATAAMVEDLAADAAAAQAGIEYAAENAVPGLYFCASYRGGVALGDRVKCCDRMASQVDAFLRA